MTPPASRRFLRSAAAREAKPELADPRTWDGGAHRSSRLRVYTSSHAHSSVDKAAITLGFGHENVVHIDTDDGLSHARGRARMRPCVQTGRPASCHSPPSRRSGRRARRASIRSGIAALCAREGMWLHVDGSYGGVAAVVPEMRHVLAGVELADSLVVNPHKWLFTPIDLSAMFTRRPDVLKRAFSLVPEYLVTREQSDVVNLMDYGVQLGRRFRALKLWMVIRAFGAEGLAARLRQQMEMAREFAELGGCRCRLGAHGPGALLSRVLSLCTCGTSEAEREALNAAILERVNASGTRLPLTHEAAWAVRDAPGDWQHADGAASRSDAWRLLREAAAATAVPADATSFRAKRRRREVEESQSY